MDIKNQLNEDLAKKIIGNKENALKYLQKLNKIKTISGLSSLRTTPATENLYKIIVKNWDYDKSKDIIREIFKETSKYKRGIESINAITKLQKEWKNLKLGPIEWPCSQGAFDSFVQRVNSLSDNGLIKDEKVKIAAVKYRRLKELNTVRNDYLETLIFNKNENIIPTLHHRQGIDFFIDGISFDQKVAKSPTNEFKRDFGDNWKDYAIKNPKTVAEYLYRFQDEGRFGSDPRLYIVYLDEDIPVIDLKKKIDDIDITRPLEVSFPFKHKIQGVKQYKTICFVILLYK